MSTIRPRTLKDGSTSYTAIITRTINGERYQETKTDAKRKLVVAWAKKRETEIDEQIKSGIKPTKPNKQRRTLGDAIDTYVEKNLRAMGDTKAQVLRTIRKEYDIAKMRCDNITSVEIVAFVEELHKRPGLNSPATASNYLEHLSAVFKVAGSAWGFQLDRDAMRKARETCKDLGLTAKAKKRERRPTLDELDKLMAHFERSSTHDPRAVPMHRILAFAIFSARREAEICRITWADYEPEDMPDETRVMVRDLKHPGDKEGNDTWCTLPEPCRDIIAAMPRKDKNEKRIFPYHSDTISRRFTDACKFLGIEDLHFHDMRHEGTSRLFEMDWNIPRVAEVTGHRSWMSLQRYAHIRAKGDIYEGWKWLDVVT
jgi:integrase